MNKIDPTNCKQFIEIELSDKYRLWLLNALSFRNIEAFFIDILDKERDIDDKLKRKEEGKDKFLDFKSINNFSIEKELIQISKTLIAMGECRKILEDSKDNKIRLNYMHIYYLLEFLMLLSISISKKIVNKLNQDNIDIEIKYGRYDEIEYKKSIEKLELENHILSKIDNIIRQNVTPGGLRITEKLLDTRIYKAASMTSKR